MAILSAGGLQRLSAAAFVSQSSELTDYSPMHVSAVLFALVQGLLKVRL